MQSRISRCVIALAVFAVLATSVRLASQELAAKQQHETERHRYRLLDVDTFGGPESNVDGVGFPPALSSGGTLVGTSATSVPGPPNSNFFICGGIDGNLPFVFHAFKQQDGRLTDLGSLPGLDNCSSALSTNGRNEVVGGSENGLIDPVLGIKQMRAVLWKDGEIKNLGTWGGNYSLAVQINNRSQVAGFALNSVPDPFSMFGVVLGVSSAGTQTRAFLWQKGHMQDLGTLGGPDALGILVNERGQVAGYSYTNSIPNATTGFPTTDPFLWNKDGMIDLGTLGGTFGLPNSLNSHGQVVGFSNLAGDQASDPFLWSDGKLIDLFTDTIGGNPITANAINDAGEIVGEACFPSGTCSAYLWRNGVATDLGMLPGDCSSEAHAINSRGEVVGQSVACDFSTRSFLWRDGSMIDLNSFVPPGSGLQLVDVVAINDRGEIAGNLVPSSCTGIPQGQDSQCGHAYVLIPCEEDSSEKKGCGDTPHAAAATIQPSPGPASVSSVNQNRIGLTPREVAIRMRARFRRKRAF